MKRLLIFICLVSVIGISPLTYSTAYAARGRVQSTARLERRVNRLLERLLRRFFNRLSADQRARVVALRSGKSSDSDFDGVSDLLESSSSRCDSDSDDDGVNDGDEYSNGSDPEDEDSDDDGHPDGQEVERKGFIESIDEGLGEIVIDGVTFLVDGNTTFEDDDDQPLSGLSDFSVGECAEAEGHEDSETSDVIADEVSKDDDC